MSDLMREEFDAWFLANAPKLSEKASWLDPDAMAIRRLARHAWKASRECMVIELPELKINGTWHFFGFVRGFRAAKNMMRSLYEIELNKIGVKTK